MHTLSPAPEPPVHRRGDPPPRRGATVFKRLVRAVLGTYLRLYHRLEIQGLEHCPPSGPLLVLTNHVSLLDVPALMVADPYPDSAIVVKSSLFKLPVVRQALEQWNAIPVDRHGRDLSGVRAVLGALRSGQVVAVAAEGRRARSGRLEPINPVLARLAAGANVPLLPVGIVGSYRALPPGARFPRPRKVVVRIGRPFTLPRGTSTDDAVRRIGQELTALLPPEQRPDAAGVA